MNSFIRLFNVISFHLHALTVSIKQPPATQKQRVT